MVRKLLRRLGSILLDMAEAPPVRPAGTADRNGLHRVVDARRRESQPVVAAGVRMVGLDDVRSEVGEEVWQRLSERVHPIVRGIVAAAIGANESYERYGDAAYILCFADAARGDPDARAAGIARQARAALVEQVPELAGISVTHSVAVVDPAGMPEGGALADALAASLACLRDEAAAAQRKRHERLLRSADVVFLPVTTARDRAPCMHRCVIGKGFGATAVQQIQSLSDPASATGVLADLDMIVLERGVRALHDLLQRGGTGMLLVPVHFQTLARRRSAERYLAICAAIYQPYTRFVMFEIGGIGRSVPLGSIAAQLPVLRPFCRSIVLSLGFQGRSFEQMSGQGVYGVSVDLQGLADPGHALQRRLEQFATRAKAAGVRSLAHNAGSLGVAELVRNVGIDFIDGPAVAPATASFGSTMRPEAMFGAPAA